MAGDNGVINAAEELLIYLNGKQGPFSDWYHLDADVTPKNWSI
jgi:hypothetical protein